LGDTSDLEEVLITSLILMVWTLMSLDVICHFLCVISRRVWLSKFHKSTNAKWEITYNQRYLSHNWWPWSLFSISGI